MERYDDDDPIYGYIKQAFKDLVENGEINLYELLDQHIGGLSIELEPITYYNDKIQIVPVLRHDGRDLYRGNKLEIELSFQPTTCEVEDPENGKILTGHVFGQGVYVNARNAY